ncbi:zinc knuckle CX2CX4HX4C containing protein [Tanacetum coccineum]|uniref:Zinc knuckle CX2CX4HX4C containing protein n=1 Tax=Tanacetum coccineum TaxID=301880 RepID=A0ABQ5G3L9_9ASTR
MMNTKGFFFFKFDTRAGLEAVLEGGPWLIRKSLIILKKWSMDTSLLKEEMTRIPIWVKLHDVPIQVFKEDGRSRFARCLIEENLEANLVDVVTIGIPSLTGDGFTKETICVEYELRPPRCDVCRIFGHVHDHCPRKESSPPTFATSNVVTPIVGKTNDGFQMVGKKKKNGKYNPTNGGQFVGPSVKQNVRYEPKVTTSAPKKGDTNVGNASKSSMLKTTSTSSKKGNIITFNSYSALDDESEEDVTNISDVSLCVGSSGYDILVFKSSWLLVKSRHRYGIFLAGYGVLDVKIVDFMISSFKLHNACLLVKLHQLLDIYCK